MMACVKYRVVLVCDAVLLCSIASVINIEFNNKFSNKLTTENFGRMSFILIT